MTMQRRSMLAALTAVPAFTCIDGLADMPRKTETSRLVLSRFANGENLIYPGVSWRGFSDRVMGGVSNATLTNAEIDGRNCLRLSGNVTRASNGGFIQMALSVSRRRQYFNAIAFRGIELVVWGNDEDYNIHVRTGDCGWHDESYRTTFHAEPRWQRLRFPWATFVPNRIRTPLDPTQLDRIGILGWMREFQADVAIAELSLYV